MLASSLAILDLPDRVGFGGWFLLFLGGRRGGIELVIDRRFGVVRSW
jgi:hypothetical protein